jgi:hypothetical protein
MRELMKRMVLIVVLLASLVLVMPMVRHQPRSYSDVGPSSWNTPRAAESSENSPGISEPRTFITDQQSALTDLLIAVNAETDLERRSDLLSAAAESMAESDLHKALNILLRVDNPAAAELRQLIVRRWAESSPHAAAEWAGRLPEGPTAIEALTQISIAWANTDLPGAVAWVKSLPENSVKPSALLNLAYEAARVEPLTSMELAIMVPTSTERDNLLVHAVSQWAAAAPGEATGWVETVPDTALRQRLLAEISISVANQNGAAAANLALNLLQPGEEQDRTVVGVVQRWAESSPRSAADWLSQFPDTPVRQIAMENLVTLWTAQDTIGAASWLRALPESSLRRAGWNAYAQAVQQQGPLGASPLETTPTGPASGPQRN